jgi:ribonucleoside-diphosphate reductase beta chain
MNLICFATCIEGMFFFAAFAYVYFLRSKGLLAGLASGTNWVFRDESMHMAFAMQVIETVRKEDPTIFNEQMEEMITQMLEDAIDCEMTFAEDLVANGIAGLSLNDMRQYLEYIADRRLESLHIAPRYKTKNPFSFMELQDMQELANFFERRVSAYQTGISGQVSFDETF